MLGGFLRGQLLVMVILGVLYGAGLTVIGLDVGILIGLIAGVLTFVPYLGPATVIILGGMTALIEYGDWQHFAGVLAVFGTGQLIESLWLTPKLVGDRIGLHPAAVIFAVLAGGQLFGFLGMLLALPVAAITNVLLRYAHERYTHSRLYAGEQPPESAIVLLGDTDVPGPDETLMHAGGQLPLALRYPPDQRLDTFTDAPAGALAQLRALAESASADWLYLNGPAGVGKTHLALATCAAAEAFGRRAAYVPLGAAKGRLQDALEAMHGNDVVALDGVDLIAGSRADELALFDFHNRARSAGVSLLYAAEVGARWRLPLTLPDLRSRLGAMRADRPVTAGRSRAAARPARACAASRTGTG